MKIQPFDLFLVVLGILLFVIAYNSTAATLPPNEHLQCRIQIVNQGYKNSAGVVVYKNYSMEDIAEIKADKIVVRGDEQVPRATIRVANGEFFTVSEKKIYRGVCRNETSIRLVN